MRKGLDPWQRITLCHEICAYNPPKEGAGAAMSGVQKGRGDKWKHWKNIDFYIDFWLAFQIQQTNQYRKITPRALKSIFYIEKTLKSKVLAPY